MIAAKKCGTPSAIQMFEHIEQLNELLPMSPRRSPKAMRREDAGQ